MIKNLSCKETINILSSGYPIIDVFFKHHKVTVTFVCRRYRETETNSLWGVHVLGGQLWIIESTFDRPRTLLYRKNVFLSYIWKIYFPVPFNVTFFLFNRKGKELTTLWVHFCAQILWHSVILSNEIVQSLVVVVYRAKRWTNLGPIPATWMTIVLVEIDTTL